MTRSTEQVQEEIARLSDLQQKINAQIEALRQGMTSQEQVNDQWPAPSEAHLRASALAAIDWVASDDESLSLTWIEGLTRYQDNLTGAI